MTLLGWSDMDENGHLLAADTGDFREARAYLVRRLLNTTPANHGKWQQLDISKSSLHATYEILNTTLWYQMPKTKHGAKKHIGPDLPWAEAHFQERIGGEPINPGVEHANWPYHAGQVELHQRGGIYDHNYMERIWPTSLTYETMPNHYPEPIGFRGYRFEVGDLNDVIALLESDPGTRQAYLPIWFPEDTGSTAGQRVPCTLGYHFIIREGVLHCQYNLRSCEIYRHFTNDIYMATRLAQHVAESLTFDVTVGQLTTHIVSLHGFVGDTKKIEELI